MARNWRVMVCDPSRPCDLVVQGLWELTEAQARAQARLLNAARPGWLYYPDRRTEKAGRRTKARASR